MENDLPARKSPRLPGFDYGRYGAYFLTFCTHNKKNILSRVVVGEGSALPISSFNATHKIELLPYGKIADRWINKIPEKFPGTYVDCYVIMPNHIHLLLSIRNGAENGRETSSDTSTNSVLGWLKYNITKEINSTEKVFQRSYYDHVIRNREDYNKIYKYIYENPMLWTADVLFAE